jgi:3-phenylpropionate/cinnamic acid dioxygenase small subunit
MVTRTAKRASGPKLQHDIEQFLYREALLLDNGEWESWLDLLTEDFVYRVPIRRHAASQDPCHGFGTPEDLALFDDDKASMGWRMRRLRTGKAWAEEPPAFTRRTIGNVIIEDPQLAGAELVVRSNFVLYRSRFGQTDIFAGGRLDHLRELASPADWSIASRVVFLDISVVPHNISLVF